MNSIPRHVLLALIFTVSVFTAKVDMAEAADAPVGISEASFLSRAAAKTALSYKGVYFGPSVGTPSGFTTDPQGKLSKAQYLENTIDLGYRVTPDFTAGFAFAFNVQPVANPGAQIKPPYLRLNAAKLISS